MMFSILIVEDDLPLQEFLLTFLKEEKYIVHAVTKGTEAIKYILKKQPSLVILDLGLPDINGENVLTTIKKDASQIPIIVLTAQAQLNNIIKMLNLGADDYLAKPFAIEELLARIKARLRTNEPPKIICVDTLSIDTEKIQVKRHNQVIKLTKTEYELLLYLVNNINKVISRESLLNHVWGYATDVETRVVDVYIGYLRKKVDLRQTKKLIYNVRSFGYVLKI